MNFVHKGSENSSLPCALQNINCVEVFDNKPYSTTDT